MNNDREYIKKIKILFILGPYDTYFPELLAKKLNEIINGMDKDWKVFAFGIQSNHQDIISSKLKCPFELCKLPTILPSKHKSGWMFSFSNLFGYILYLIACIWYGRKLVIKEKIHIIYMHNNFLQLNLTGYILSRLTKTRCIVRVSADFLIPLTFYLKNSKRETTQLIRRKIEEFDNYFLLHFQDINLLETINPKLEAARIGHSVGTRKRIEIEEYADELGIRILNRG